MEKLIVFFITIFMLYGCNPSSEKKEFLSKSDISREKYDSFGADMNIEKIYLQNVVAKKYEDLKNGDTLEVTFTSTVKNVCKAKGCWMTLNLDNNNDVMVKFKEYGFFVPKNIEKDTVIVKGRAFVQSTSVEEQRHYASDAKKSKEEINSINTPKRTYSFVADAVLLKK